MAPPGRGTKRRVSERSDFDPNDGSRPSPHHPSGISTATRYEPNRPPVHSPTQRGRGRGRGGRSGRGGRGGFQAIEANPRSELAVDGANDQPIRNSTQSQDRVSNTWDATQAAAAAAQNTSFDRPERTMTPNKSVQTASSQARAPQAPPARPKTPPAMLYEFLTEDRLESWQEDGRQWVLQKSGETITQNDISGLLSIMHELVRSAMDDRLDAHEAGATVNSIIQSAPSDAPIDASEIFLDTVSAIPGVDMNSRNLKALCFATQIPAEQMRNVFESDVLIALGLVQSAFSRMFIRKQTNILYKQSNYNLLREETEGYSKLITELFSVSQEPEPTSDTANETFKNMKALIGAFDLDAGRVLDVTLDVCASTLIKNHRFFVKLLRMSDYWPQATILDGLSTSAPPIDSLPLWADPDHYDWRLDESEMTQIASLKQRRDRDFWYEAKSLGMDAFFTLGRRRVLSDDERIRETQTVLQQPQNESTVNLLEWISKTRTLPPAGSSVAAQLLGFKLRFYASNIRGEGDSMPPSLIYMTAMLIKIGFISLLDIYPHLSPADDSMESVREKGLQEKAEREQAKRGGATVNALTRAGALADDAPPTAASRIRIAPDRAATPVDGKVDATKEDMKSDSSHPAGLPDQKISLLKSLLCIGALPESLFMLGRFPWLLDTVPDLPKLVFRVLHQSLSAVYESTLPEKDSLGLEKPAQLPSEDQSGVSKGSLRLTDAPYTRVIKWAQSDTKDAGEGIDYKFYWDDWADNVPVCQSVDDVFTICGTMLNLVGVKIGQDATLITKLARIGDHSLNADPSQSNKDRWLDLLKRMLCPALSLTRSNTAVVGEVFTVLKRFPIQARYNIYAEWFTGPTSRMPDVAEAFNLTRYETKDIMKKVNKLDSGPSARKLAKASASAPGIVFEIFLRQLEQYDNLIDVVVDCGTHFTELSYDVLTWSILTYLGNEGRGRISQTGFTANKWLVSLSSFTGKILRRYSAMTVQPFVQYILSQLRKNSYIDIRVLRDIVQQMSGVTALVDLTDAQMMALAGGELLRSETLRQLQDRRTENMRAARRLIASLIDNNTGGALLIAIAQQRELCVYNHDQDDNKILSEIYDEVNTVFRQCLDMIRANTTSEQFAMMVPEVSSLIAEYGLAPSTAFSIQRFSLSLAMSEYGTKHGTSSKSRAPSNEKPQVPDVAMITESTEKGASQGKDDSMDIAETAVEDALDAAQPHGSAPTPPDTVPTPPAISACHPILQELAHQIEPVLASELKTYISVPFLVTFWQLSLSDLLAPTNIYEDEMKKLLARKAAIVPDRADASAAGAKRRDAEKKFIDETHDKFMKEMRGKMKYFQVVQGRLTREKDQWFSDPQGDWNSLNHTLLQECFLPRLVLSPLDSYYAQKMLFFLHSKGARNFRTMLFFDRLFETQSITNLIYTCSSKEAENLGKFLAEVLKTLNEWHADRKEYEKKALGQHTSSSRILPGFASKMSSGGQPENMLDFEEYRNLLYKWHRKLSEGLRKCLDQYEYMYVKNAITILTTIAPHYPATKTMGLDFLHKLQQVRDREQPAGENEKPKPLARQDLWTSANSAQAPLKRREKQWVMPHEFCTAKGKAAAPSAINTKVSAQAQSNGAAQLDAKAPDFAPKALPTTNGVPMSAASVEDGEVKDTPMVDAPKMRLPTPESRPRSNGEGPRERTSEGQAAQLAPQNQLEPAKDATPITKLQEPSIRPLASSADQREDERIYKQRAMESMKRRTGSDVNHTKEEKPSQPEAPSSKPSTPLPSRPPSRNYTEQAPDGPRSDRERPVRNSSYDTRNVRPQQENGHLTPSRTNTDRGPPPRYAPDSARPPRQSDMSYGRLNAEPDPAGSPSSRPPPRGPTSGSARDFAGDRRQNDGQSVMGPPPRRDYPPATARPPYDSNRGAPDKRPVITPSGPADRATGINPERARLIGDTVSPTRERPSSQNQPVAPQEQTRLPPIQPPSPRGPRNGIEQGASIRGQASISSPDGRMSFGQQSPIQATNGPATPTSEASGVHPSRMAQIEGAPRPPPIQTSPQDATRRAPAGPGFAASPANAPSGPRSAGPPSASSPSSYAPPSGPANGPGGNQYNRTEGTRRQFGRIQETLNQSNQASRPPPNGTGPRNGPVTNVVPPPPPPAPLRGHPSEVAPPSASRIFDSRGPPPPSQYQAGRNLLIPPPRERDGPGSPRDVRGAPQPPRSEVALPPQPPPAAAFDRGTDRAPRRDVHGDPRDQKDYQKDYRELRPDLFERPELRDSRPARPDNRDYREPRTERPDLIPRDSGPRRGPRETQREAPRELIPGGPMEARDGRDARLRETDRTRERSPRGDVRRETREQRDYPKEYRDRRDEPRGPREEPRGPRDGRTPKDFGTRGVRRDERQGAPPPRAEPHWRDERKRDFDGFDQDASAPRGRDTAPRGGRR